MDLFTLTNQKSLHGLQIGTLMGSLVSDLLTQENWISSSVEQPLRISPSVRTVRAPTEKKVLISSHLDSSHH